MNNVKLRKIEKPLVETLPNECICIIFEYNSIKELFENIMHVSKEVYNLINYFNSCSVLKSKLVEDLKCSSLKEISSLSGEKGNKKLKEMIKESFKVQMIFFYNKYRMIIENPLNNRNHQEFFRYKKRKKIRVNFIDESRKFSLGDNVIMRKKALKKFFNYRSDIEEKPTSLYLHSFRIIVKMNKYLKSKKRMEGSEKSVIDIVCVENVNEVIKKAFRIMPNLRKIYLEIREIAEGLSSSWTELLWTKLRESIISDIKKNFEKEEKAEVKEISGEKVISNIQPKNNIQTFEVKYRVNEILKSLKVYFVYVMKREKNVTPEFVEHLEICKPFKTALKFLSEDYDENFNS